MSGSERADMGGFAAKPCSAYYCRRSFIRIRTCRKIMPLTNPRTNPVNIRLGQVKQSSSSQSTRADARATCTASITSRRTMSRHHRVRPFRCSLFGPIYSKKNLRSSLPPHQPPPPTASPSSQAPPSNVQSRYRSGTHTRRQSKH